MEWLIKNTKILGIVVAPADIYTGNLPDTSPERYRCDNLLDSTVRSRRLSAKLRLCVPRVRVTRFVKTRYCSRDRLASRYVYLRFEDEYAGVASQSWGPEEAQETGRPLRLELENTAQARRQLVQ
jgi:hypothetical protein